MPDPTRRTLFRQAAGLGALAAMGVAPGALARPMQPSVPTHPMDDGAPGGAAEPPPNGGAVGRTDRDFVMAAGMTADEATCWALTAEAAGAFFALPELHPMDRQEVASAIHIIQNKLLSRPTYRRYLELAKAAYGER